MMSTPDNSIKKIARRLRFLYNELEATKCLAEILVLMKRYSHLTRQKSVQTWSEKDIVLITYSDQVRHPSLTPLQTLNRFLVDNDLPSLINTIHLLPFYPFSSDDGFSVVDYMAVDPIVGTWSDVETIRENFTLMFDLVLNHISQRSDWFQKFCQGDPQYLDFFIEVTPEMDISSVVRPRSLPLMHEFETSAGPKKIWTTFSRDQVDLNYENPRVLCAMLEVLLHYVEHGARIIRLDAVAFLWKTSGTTCLHLKQTHQVIKFYRDVLSIVAPHVILLTETNVPHEENISYFGDGDEAHMIYQFSLPSLLADALIQEDARPLRRWLLYLDAPLPGTTFFNFTASHDGIGIRPLEGLVPWERVAALVTATEESGGQISVRQTPDGNDIPYELNVTYRDLLGTNQDLIVDRFILSQAVMLSLAGIPGIYFHSLVGSGNDISGMEESGIPRRINRLKYDLDELSHVLADKGSLQFEIFNRYRSLVCIRTQQGAFHPNGDQVVLDIDNQHVLGFSRTNPDKTESIVVLYNFSCMKQTIRIKNNSKHSGTDLMTKKQVILSRPVTLAPLMFRWVKLNVPA
jgi:sucrose phosphorylase